MNNIKNKTNNPLKLIYIENKFNKNERLVFNHLIEKIKIEKENILKAKKHIEEGGFTFSNYTIKMNLSELIKDLKVDNYLAAKKILTGLQNKRIIINEIKKDYIENILIVGKIIEKNKSVFELSIDPVLIELVLTQNSNLILETEEEIEFKSKYSTIVYELIKATYSDNQQPTELKYSLFDFKKILGIENKYIIEIEEYVKHSINPLKKKVLEVIEKDINENTKYNLTYKLKKIQSYSFDTIEISFDLKNEFKEIKEELINGMTFKELENLSREELIKICVDKILKEYN